MAAGDRQVEKIMSMTLADFHRNLKVLAPECTLGPQQQTVRLDLDGASAEIRFESMASKTYGNLLNIPRARVTLSFDESSAETRQAFIDRFDFAFRRGGG